jgi:signal transduction histidine kinase
MDRPRRVSQRLATTSSSGDAGHSLPSDAMGDAVGVAPRAADGRPAGATREERDVRQRIVAAGDAAREQIERDLHDGAQQRLTALAIGLGVAAEQFRERGHDEFGAVLDGFGREVQEAIDELRELAHGVYPTLLADHGLSAALVAAGRHSGLAVTVRSDDVARYPQEVESAVYFSCVAAMHNAVKHAGPSEVALHVWETAGTLRFSVSDTGSGFDPERTWAGAGITNIHDRITAIGGSLTIASAPRQGTRLLGAIPIAVSATNHVTRRRASES